MIGMWPLEGSPRLVRWISYATPTALPAISLRAIIEKNYSMDEFEVYIGLLLELLWIVILFIGCISGLRLKSL